MTKPIHISKIRISNILGIDQLELELEPGSSQSTKMVQAKSYGNGFIDAKGDFYHKTAVEFLEVVE